MVNTRKMPLFLTLLANPFFRKTLAVIAVLALVFAGYVYVKDVLKDRHEAEVARIEEQIRVRELEEDLQAIQVDNTAKAEELASLRAELQNISQNISRSRVVIRERVESGELPNGSTPVMAATAEQIAAMEAERLKEEK